MMQEDSSYYCPFIDLPFQMKNVLHTIVYLYSCMSDKLENTAIIEFCIYLVYNILRNK